LYIAIHLIESLYTGRDSKMLKIAPSPSPIDERRSELSECLFFAGKSLSPVE
jgi:hypothetical protein